MFRNYLKIAFRNFLKQKSFSFINVLGLSVGIACFVLIMLYVQYELSFDRYHEYADRIYRVVMHQPGNTYLGSDHFAVTPAILGPTLKEEFPEVRHAVTIDKDRHALITVDGKSFYEDGLLWADAELFDIFTFPLAIGDPETALAEPYSILLSESQARKYFGQENPIGRIMRYQDEYDFKVTGILKDVPGNSHFHFDMLASFQTKIAVSEYKDQFTQWGNNSWFTYILVPPDFDRAAFDIKLTQIVKKYHTESWRDQDNPHRYYLQPLTDIHLHSHINFDIGRNNDIRYLYLLSGLALLVLLIACINYMNLTTARASLRMKEVGVRKVIGASRPRLIKQFIGEAFSLTVVAAGMALLLVELVLPIFSSLVERELRFALLFRTNLLISLLTTVILVGILAGAYPAFYLTSFRPARVLKGVFTEGGRSRLRSMLVVFQFATSVALIVCTLVVQDQLNFIKHKKLGYNRESVLVMRMRDPEARSKFHLIKRDLLQHPAFTKVTTVSHLPTHIGSQTGLGWTERDGQEAVSSYQARVGSDFLDIFEIALVEGRNFSPDHPTDSTDAFIINEKLRDRLGWASGVGKAFGRGDEADGTVIGVMKNFHMHSLRQEIHPLFIQLSDRGGSFVAARIHTQDIPGAIEYMATVWQKYSPNYPFEHFFLDDEFNKMYQTEQKLANVFTQATFLAIFVACLGLFGLAAFTAERRTKEIGIRKVLGASITGIVTLLSKDFVRLILVAMLVAAPVAYFAMNQWLQDFAYRVSLDWWIFGLAGGLALLIAVLTVSAQAVKAALANPVDSLRYE